YALDMLALPDALRRAGVDPDSVTDVVLTHLHWDHAGGITTREPGTDRAVPALPRARLHVGATHRAYATAPSPKDRGSFRTTEVAQATDPRTHVLRDEGEVLPGIFAWRSDGHTKGLLILEARAQGRRVVFPTDLVPTLAHARPAWGMAYDNFPLTVAD